MADMFQKYTILLKKSNILCALLLTSCSRIFRSELFTFVVGEDRKAIVVHSAAITEHSKVLSALVNNGMVESQTRSAVLDDVDESTFIRFCQFAFTGDYSTPPFTEDEIPIPDVQEAAPIDDDDWAPSTKKGKNNKKGKKSFSLFSDDLAAPAVSGVTPFAFKGSTKVWSSWGLDVSQVNYQDLGTLKTKFEHREFCKEPPRQKLLDSCEPLPNSQPNHNFTPVFLAHSRLYVFADKYGIIPLQQLVLQKLHQTLVRFEMHPERVEDVVELVRYAYSDDHTFSDGNDELRALVAVYMASSIDKLNQSESFLTLLEEGGVFVRDFWMLVRNALYV
jgi:hypothetical protein